MNFPTPADNGSNAVNNDDSTAVYDSRMDDQEEYWAVVDTERFLQKMCVSYGVAVDNGFARYTEAEGESPLADHGLFYYRTKKEMADDLSSRREDGDLDSDQTLPEYKDQFETPEYDHVVVSADNAGDFGLDADLFDDNEEIFLPEDYEPETDGDGNLVVWYETDGETTYTKDDVLETLRGVDGIGPKTAGKALNALESAGIVNL